MDSELPNNGSIKKMNVIKQKDAPQEANPFSFVDKLVPKMLSKSNPQGERLSEKPALQGIPPIEQLIKEIKEKKRQTKFEDLPEEAREEYRQLADQGEYNKIALRLGMVGIPDALRLEMVDMPEPSKGGAYRTCDIRDIILSIYKTHGELSAEQYGSDIYAFPFEHRNKIWRYYSSGNPVNINHIVEFGGVSLPPLGNVILEFPSELFTSVIPTEGQDKDAVVSRGPIMLSRLSDLQKKQILGVFNLAPDSYMGRQLYPIT